MSSRGGCLSWPTRDGLSVRGGAGIGPLNMCSLGARSRPDETTRGAGNAARDGRGTTHVRLPGKPGRAGYPTRPAGWRDESEAARDPGPDPIGPDDAGQGTGNPGFKRTLSDHEPA